MTIHLRHEASGATIQKSILFSQSNYLPFSGNAFKSYLIIQSSHVCLLCIILYIRCIVMTFVDVNMGYGITVRSIVFDNMQAHKAAGTI
jgi:hypothetical protein